MAADSIRQPAAVIGLVLAAGAEITAPSVAGMRGHPVGFSATFRESLFALSGDIGARSIVEANVHRLKTLACDDQGILTDLDTPADISRQAVLRRARSGKG
ncbi:hypothetical protein LLG90_19795 [Aromatoleum toluclasticum]|uniref:nucleotidyltransferase family protein n=1 Tax=Aromatoleum toluclasticum TaxID=92003 RepID=UPI001D18A4A1|nr:hypothetical protein [Aromatoleum toluclasticum]MCC4117606.1 hypothetical protein [Aromatoleum toluclasticum]